MQDFSHDSELKILLFNENAQNKGLENGLVQFIEENLNFTLKCIVVVVIQEEKIKGFHVWFIDYSRVDKTKLL